MNTAPANLRVSDAERNEAISMIQAAYADGRLDESAMERHLELAFDARTRLELAQAVHGLRRPGTPPLFASSMQPRPTGLAPLPPRPGVPATNDATLAGLTHLSAIPFSFLGPLVVWMFASTGSPLKREAAKALNFQVIVLAVGIVAAIVGAILNIGFLSGIVSAAWLTLTIISGVKALQGQNWTNPVTAIVGKRIVRED